MSQVLMAKHIKIANLMLVGHRIIRVRYQDDDEQTTLDWSRRGIVLILDNGTHIHVQSDDEGNNAGSLLVVTKSNAVSTIPTF